MPDPGPLTGALLTLVAYHSNGPSRRSRRVPHAEGGSDGPEGQRQGKHEKTQRPMKASVHPTRGRFLHLGKEEPIRHAMRDVVIDPCDLVAVDDGVSDVHADPDIGT